VLEAHAWAHSTAPGARLWDGLKRPSEHDVNGWPRTIFTPHRRSPAGEIQDYGTRAAVTLELPGNTLRRLKQEYWSERRHRNVRGGHRSGGRI
jgi:hypothetical protein